MGKRAGAVRVKQMGPKMPPMAAMPTLEDFATPPEAMLHLPPPPDRSYQVIWPMRETFTMKFDDFRVIYPSYLDSNKTCHQGRRLPKAKAVPTPTCTDLSQALQALQIRHVVQPYKGYPRDITCLWDNPGRVLVDLSSFESRGALMVALAERIPHLPARLVRLEQEARVAQAAEEERKERLKQEKAASSALAAASKKAAKKGKKGSSKKK